MEKKYLVECVSCGKMVVVSLDERENWHTAVCPVCRKLAYNSQGLPPAERAERGS